jgi:hypothetical protein
MSTRESDIDTTVRVRIARLTSNIPPYSTFQLQVTDEKSGITFLTVPLTPEQYATVVSCGNDSAELPAEFRGMEFLGMVHENKTVNLTIPLTEDSTWGDPFMVLVREAIVEHEVDGWKARSTDLTQFNGHRIKRDNEAGTQTYSVHMFRYVEGG